MSVRFKVVTLFLVGCGLFLGYLLVDRMVISRKKFATSPFVDKKFVETIERLEKSGAFYVNGRLVGINEEVLGRAAPARGIQEKVRQAVSSGALYSAQGRVVFNPRFCAKANPKKEHIVLRGGFFDRNGVSLTATTVNAKLFLMKREYGFGREFSPVIGHFNAIYGARNLEKELDPYLSGRAHYPVPQDENDPFNPVILGDDVVLTLDSGLQKYGYDLMGKSKGALVVVDVKTGEVLAAVSTPSYDPNTKDRQVWDRVSHDKDDKLYQNRAFSVLYPLGSTFKTVVTIAWLDSAKKGDDRPGFSVLCTGKRNQYHIADEYKEHGHGTVNLEKGFVQSCNPFFSELGVALGPTVADYTEKLGFNSPINLIPQVGSHGYFAATSLAYAFYDYSGSEKTLHAYTKRDFRRNKGIVAQCAIGQNLVSATPLQMALVAAAVANGGMLVNPSVVREIRTARGEKMVESKGLGDGGRRVMREATAAVVRGLMQRVMTDGTGKHVKKLYVENGAHTTEPVGDRPVPVPVAGKTGTAETGRSDRAHSWFIGFAPADNPRVAIAVIAENGGKGGAVAAPKAVEMLARALDVRTGVPGAPTGHVTLARIQEK